MKPVAIPLARTCWLVDIWRVNPHGRSLNDVFAALAARYKFAKVPQTPMEVKDDALEFQYGSFVYEGIPLAVGLRIYNNGISADTLASTDASEAFLQDMSSWLKKDYGIEITNSIVRKFYVSQIDVECEIALDFINPRLAAFARRMSECVTALDGKPKTYALNGINFWSEDIGTREAPISFRFERKWGLAFDRNVYFTTAPMSTQDHLTLLNDLEAILRTG